MPDPGLPPAGSPPPRRARPPLPAAQAKAVAPVVKSTTPKARHSRTGMLVPPQGALTPEQRAITAREEVAFATLETELGGRSGLIAAMSAAHLTSKFDALLGMIADPIHDHESLGQVCALAGVSVGQLMGVLQDAAAVKGRILATQRIAQRLPDVAAAVMEDAIPGVRQCAACLGARWVSKPTNDDPSALVECPTCKGIGTMVHQPDHDVQKTALKIGGLLNGGGKGGAGVNVSVLQANTQVNPGDSGNYDALIGLLDKAMYGEGRDRIGQGRRVQTVLDVSGEPGVEGKGQTEA